MLRRAPFSKDEEKLVASGRAIVLEGVETKVVALKGSPQEMDFIQEERERIAAVSRLSTPKV